MSSTHPPFGRPPGVKFLDDRTGIFTSMLLSAVIGCSYFLDRGHDDQRLLQIAFLSLFCINALFRKSNPLATMSSNRDFLSWSVLAFFLLGSVSSALAMSPRHAFLEVAIFLMLFLLALRIAEEVAGDSKHYVPIVLKACAIGSALYALEIVVIYLTALALRSQPSVEDFTPGFSNIRFLNHAQTISLPLLVLLCALDKPGWKAKWGYLALTAFCWTLLFITAGRGTFVGLLAGTVGVFAVRGKHASAFCKTMLLTALAGMAMYAVFFTWIPAAIGLEPFGLAGQVVQRTAADPTSLRGPLWTRALELIAAHPWSGVGPLHYAHFAIDGQLSAHPHNWILQIGAEWGLPALLCLLAAIGLSMRRLVLTASRISADDHGNQNMLAAWIATGLAILVDGLVSGSIIMPVSQLWIALYIGCASGWVMSINSTSQLPRQPRLRRCVNTVLLLLALAAVVIGTGSDMGSRGSLGAAAAKENQGRNNPRIWINGYF
ncbi:O-antigen ligase family protein [Massilia psychrophila]|nr:O-antigen ligase family protein [Massilia psychrophila]